MVRPLCIEALLGRSAYAGRTTFTGKLKGRRFTLYIPEDLVPEVRRCLDNGRALQELLFEAAPRYVKALKRQKSKSAKASVG